jgi:hypothetical protein
MISLYMKLRNGTEWVRDGIEPSKTHTTTVDVHEQIDAAADEFARGSREMPLQNASALSDKRQLHQEFLSDNVPPVRGLTYGVLLLSCCYRSILWR